MAFRRSNRWSRKVSPRFGARRGLRRATSPQRWERADFFIEDYQSLPGGSAAEQLQMFHLGSISQSLVNDVANPTLALAVASMQRRFEVGGIVFDYGHEQEAPIDATVDKRNGNFWIMTGLCVDKLATFDQDGLVAPNAIAAWSPWTSQFPVAIVRTTSPSPAQDTRENSAPQRVLWSRTRYHSGGIRQVDNQQEGSLYVPDEQLLAAREGAVNRRLRLSLDDEQALFFFIATRNCASFELGTSARVIHHWARGALYFRFRQ